MAAIDTLRIALFGSPPDPNHEPSREGVLAAFEELVGNVEDIAASGLADVAKTTRALLNADLNWPANSIAIVYADATEANNDFYIKVGASGTGSWTLTSILGDAVDAHAAPAIAQVQSLADAVASGLEGTYTPLLSFGGGVGGWWYKFSERDLLWKNTSNTDPIRNDGDVIAKAFDKSPNAQNISQATVASRPIFARTREGLYGALFDGVDDFMPAPTALLTASFELTVVAAVHVINNTGVIYSEARVSSTTPYLYLSSGTSGSSGTFGSDGTAKLQVGTRNDANVNTVLDSTDLFGVGQNHIVTLRIRINPSDSSQRLVETWIDDRYQGFVVRSGAITLDTKAIGALIRASASSFLRGTIFEIVGVAKAMSNTETLACIRYLAKEHFTTRRSAAGLSTAVHPRIVDFFGRPLVGTTTLQGAARVTELSISPDGLRGPSYSGFKHGSVSDPHWAPAVHLLADIRVLMVSVTHNSMPLAVTVSNPGTLVATVPGAAPTPWPIARAEILPGVESDAAYPRLFEKTSASLVYLFVRSRAVGETSAQRGLWRFDTASTMASAFANPVKLVGGDRPYVYITQDSTGDVFECVMSTGNPGDSPPFNNIYHARHKAAANTMHLSDDTVVANGSDVSAFTILHDEAVDGRPAWTYGRPWYGRDGYVRGIYIVYNPDGSQEFVFRRWTGTAWTAPLILAVCAGPTSAAVWFSTGGFDPHPNNPDVVFISRNVGPVGTSGETIPHQIWRFTCRDGLDDWDDGVQLTFDTRTAAWPACSNGSREPLLAYSSYDPVTVGNSRSILIHSGNGRDDVI